MTVVPDASGNPGIGVGYRANVRDRYDWGEGGTVGIGPPAVPDGQTAKLHRVGLAQEFDMVGSSSVHHCDLGSSKPDGDPLPGPDDSRGGRLDPGREQPQDRTTGMPVGRTDSR